MLLLINKFGGQTKMRNIVWCFDMVFAIVMVAMVIMVVVVIVVMVVWMHMNHQSSLWFMFY